MDDFTYDVMQKKSIASGARHKANGSRSRFVSLPSDNMTPSQIQKLNGPCKTYNLGDRMSWSQFKAMPKDLQQQYLDGLSNRFGVTQSVISTDLFALSRATLHTYIERTGLRNPGGGRLSFSRRIEWERWLNSQCSATSKDGDVLADERDEDCGMVSLGEISATFTGTFEPEKFLKLIAMFPMPEGRVKIRVEVTKE